MLRTHLVAGLAFSALLTGTALAQTPAQTPGATAPAGAGQVMTQMQPNMMRATKLSGVDVYGSDNQKIGDIDELLLDRDGKIQAIVVGVGGFLGLGQKDVAIPFAEVQWQSSDEARTAMNTGSGTNTAGGVTTPAAPATTGSTGTAGTAGTSMPATAARSDDGTPARAMVKMSKADLQSAPEFRYVDDSRASATGNTSPPASAPRPGTAPAQ